MLEEWNFSEGNQYFARVEDIDTWTEFLQLATVFTLTSKKLAFPIRNADSVQITNRQTFRLKLGQVHTCTQYRQGTNGKQQPTDEQLATGTSFPKEMKHSI